MKRFDVEIECCDVVNDSSLYDEDEDDCRPPVITLPDRYTRFKCRVVINSSSSISEEKEKHENNDKIF